MFDFIYSKWTLAIPMLISQTNLIVTRFDKHPVNPLLTPLLLYKYLPSRVLLFSRICFILASVVIVWSLKWNYELFATKCHWWFPLVWCDLNCSCLHVVKTKDTVWLAISVMRNGQLLAFPPFPSYLSDLICHNMLLYLFTLFSYNDCGNKIFNHFNQ